MTKAAARLDFEYAAVLRDRAARLAELSERLAAWRGEVDGLTFLYRVPGFRGVDRLYLIRRGCVRTELEYPKGARARARAAGRVEEVFNSREPAPRVLEGDDAAEILFVAGWFRARPRELRRTKTPKEWLAGSKRSSAPRAARAVRGRQSSPEPRR